MKEKFFFSRDSEGAFGMESTTRGGSFSTRSRLGKAVAGSGLRGQDERDQWKQTGCARKMEENGWRHVFGAKIGARNERTVFFLGIQRERLAWKVQPGEARFGAELDWVKPWRGQVFGARLCTRNERKGLSFSRDSEGAFGMESATSRFRPELDWEKPWRGQVFGAKMSETNGNKLDAREKWKKTVGGACSGLSRIRLGKAVAGSGVRSQTLHKK